jgi:hypothetical protein
MNAFLFRQSTFQRYFELKQVSHHPTLIACHCEGRGWKFWGDSNLRTKFWGRSIQLDPVGILTLEFDDGEIFQWSKVCTSVSASWLVKSFDLLASISISMGCI